MTNRAITTLLTRTFRSSTLTSSGPSKKTRSCSRSRERCSKTSHGAAPKRRLTSPCRFNGSHRGLLMVYRISIGLIRAWIIMNKTIWAFRINLLLGLLISHYRTTSQMKGSKVLLSVKSQNRSHQSHQLFHLSVK